MNVIQICIITVLLLQELQYTLKIFNFFFTSVFILEAIIRIISFGMCRYLLDR